MLWTNQQYDSRLRVWDVEKSVATPIQGQVNVPPGVAQNVDR